MYIGVNEETGKTVQEEDAFSYACDSCLKGSIDEKETFLEIARNCEDMQEFAEVLVEWFYSGNWMKEVTYEHIH